MGKVLGALLCILLLGACSKEAKAPAGTDGADQETEATSTELEIKLPEEETVESKSQEPIEPFPEEETEPEGSEYKWEKKAIIGTDIHYLSRDLTDGGSRFQYMVEHGDGKVVSYVEQITDAFLEEVIQEKPDMLILSGDLTLDGVKKRHEELAGK